jgi:hypothetical protein
MIYLLEGSLSGCSGIGCQALRHLSGNVSGGPGGKLGKFNS